MHTYIRITYKHNEQTTLSEIMLRINSYVIELKNKVPAHLQRRGYSHLSPGETDGLSGTRSDWSLATLPPECQIPAPSHFSRELPRQRRHYICLAMSLDQTSVTRFLH